ncbi:FkbM family methyltransferase [Desulfovibrio sp. OttesenSCG-928-M14]|nr:FkbM family methyltransferase [Desulfovibrio sp. OttesenSCG-928-M14]
MRKNNKYHGFNDLDCKLEKYIDYDSGFYVELGANNGVNQSNTYYFETYKNWRGILIEPVLHNYFQCKQIRSPENKFFCNACVSFAYTEEFVPLMYSNLMTTTLHVESDIPSPRQHAEMGRRFLSENEDIILFGAKARTLNDILLEAEAPQQIDLLSLDVEGAEIEVLKGLDFKQFRFKYMCIECRDIDTMKSFLNERGYEPVAHLADIDYLFAPCASHS